MTATDTKRDRRALRLLTLGLLTLALALGLVGFAARWAAANDLDLPDTQPRISGEGIARLKEDWLFQADGLPSVWRIRVHKSH